MPTGTEILQRAAILLNDEEYARWTVEELVDWINEGTKAVILAKPSARSSTRELALAVGTLQKVPTAGAPVPLALLSIIRNLKASGDPRQGGRIIRVANKADLDAQDPYWHDQRRTPYTKEVRNFVFTEESPLEFYVWPGNNGTGIVEALLSDLPPRLTATGASNVITSYGGEIGLPEPYSVPLLDFVLSQAFAKDDTIGNGGRAMTHYQKFGSAVGLKIQVEGATSPNARRGT